MKIAVIGAGISGLGAAYALKDIAEVTVFEKDNRFGGHAQTSDVNFGDARIAVDTGFIVYNYRNYPNLTGLFEHLDVPTKWSDMSFGLSVNGGKLEYACDSLNQIFAQRLNALNPKFLNGLRDILRFNKTAPGLLDSGALQGLTLGQFIEKHNYSNWFRDCFAAPFGGAIWSTPVGEIMEFPAENFVAFFRNHDLMCGMEPMQRWRTVEGGSREYVSRLLAALGGLTHKNAKVVEINRASGRPEVVLADGSRQVFDEVILACHAPQSAKLLKDQDVQERALLSSFRTTDNLAVLHSDPNLMPKRKRVWSSWNFLSDGFEQDLRKPAPVTYWMQRLQGLDRAHDLFVSLNPAEMPRENLVHGTFSYAHPLYDAAAFEAQAGMDTIQGRGGVWYAGAWLGYGFHEDGLRSGLRVAASLGAHPVWAKGMPEAIVTPLAEAAE